MEDFSAIIRQQPSRGRMCGLGDTVSRRMLDPPLIIQLLLPQPAKNYQPFEFICNTTILDAEDGTHNGLICFSKTIGHKTLSTSIKSVLLGQTVTTGVLLNDMKSNELQIFFVFPELAVRIQGDFKLCCNIGNLNT
ncbi:hypothetical protein HDV06_001443 [Boothiomyces sp. JEL0866]|nr:hypothetical protein HDV06_001443 [Boothiomyces sp. JEL0866]